MGIEEEIGIEIGVEIGTRVREEIDIVVVINRHLHLPVKTPHAPAQRQTRPVPRPAQR